MIRRRILAGTRPLGIIVHTENSITIGAPVDRVYDLGARIEDWPETLPHYRWVTILRDEGTRRIVEMAASRDGFPVKWTSIQELDPNRRAIRYRHVRGISRGMVVAWSIEPGPAGTEVRIVHDFDPPWPRPPGPLVARYIVGDMFVRNVADKTLRHIKRIAESELAAQPSTAAKTAVPGSLLEGRVIRT